MRNISTVSSYGHGLPHEFLEKSRKNRTCSAPEPACMNEHVEFDLKKVSSILVRGMMNLGGFCDQLYVFLKDEILPQNDSIKYIARLIQQKEPIVLRQILALAAYHDQSKLVEFILSSIKNNFKLKYKILEGDFGLVRKPLVAAINQNNIKSLKIIIKAFFDMDTGERRFGSYRTHYYEWTQQYHMQCESLRKSLRCIQYSAPRVINDMIENEQNKVAINLLCELKDRSLLTIDFLKQLDQINPDIWCHLDKSLDLILYKMTINRKSIMDIANEYKIHGLQNYFDTLNHPHSNASEMFAESKSNSFFRL